MKSKRLLATKKAPLGFSALCSSFFLHLDCCGETTLLCDSSSAAMYARLMSSAMFLASKVAPSIPFLPNPATYSPRSPFHVPAAGFLGNPSAEKKPESSYTTTTNSYISTHHHLDITLTVSDQLQLQDNVMPNSATQNFGSPSAIAGHCCGSQWRALWHQTL